ncbi:VOC family protein [Nonomuraea sp. NPDC050328]|uniref:VOC family protein n=1 Tax=Nonomuraea sp. NPDC050328 TaxID=3364361 RepID=UPI0037A4DC30
MSERNGYAPGVPCWVDLSSTDTEASARFYTELLGWRVKFSPDPAAGGYGQFFAGGKVVAGIGPTFTEGMPSVWNTYVATDDAAAVADRAKNAGGQVVIEPMEVLDQGTMAVLQAADGGFVSVWQAAAHHGAQLVNEPGAWCWNELNSRDVEAAERFYRDVFGWTVDASTMEVPGLGPYTYRSFLSEGHLVAGMVEMSPNYPDQVPSFWVPYFAVADLDGTVAKSRELGANVFIDRMDSPAGPFALLQDPQGALAYVMDLQRTE